MYNKLNNYDRKIEKILSKSLNTTNFTKSVLNHFKISADNQKFQTFSQLRKKYVKHSKNPTRQKQAKYFKLISALKVKGKTILRIIKTFPLSRKVSKHF